MAVAASVAWWIGTLAGEPAPVFAAIVPLVAIRKQDPFGAFGVSAGRILGVFAGVLIGLAALQISPDGGVPIAIATICVSLAAALVLRIGDELNVQITVSALIMLFLADTAQSAGIDRVWETAMGAIIAAVVVTFMWPPNPVAAVRARLPRMRGQLGADLTATVDLVANPREADEVLERVRANQLLARDDALALPGAERALRWNVLHRGDRATLEKLTEQVLLLARLHRHLRSLARSIADATAEAIDDVRPAHGDLERAARELAATFAPKLAAGDAQTKLDHAAAALDDFAARGQSRLAIVIEIDMRRMITDLRAGRVAGEALPA